MWEVGWGDFAYAEKSAAAVAEMAASAESLACHTAPLWPRNVPILGLMLVGASRVWFHLPYQSPVMPSRSMGLLSLVG